MAGGRHPRQDPATRRRVIRTAIALAIVALVFYLFTMYSIIQD